MADVMRSSCPCALGLLRLLVGLTSRCRAAGVDVRSFCQTYMADGVPFFIDFHTAKGDEQVTVLRQDNLTGPHVAALRDSSVEAIEANSMSTVSSGLAKVAGLHTWVPPLPS